MATLPASPQLCEIVKVISPALHSFSEFFSSFVSFCEFLRIWVSSRMSPTCLLLFGFCLCFHFPPAGNLSCHSRISRYYIRALLRKCNLLSTLHFLEAICTLGCNNESPPWSGLCKFILRFSVTDKILLFEWKKYEKKKRRKNERGKEKLNFFLRLQSSVCCNFFCITPWHDFLLFILCLYEDCFLCRTDSVGAKMYQNIMILL